MLRKTAVAGFIFVILVVAVIDKYSLLLGAFICSVITYWSTTTFLNSWVEGVFMKVDRAPIRFSRHHRRKKSIPRCTCPSGILLPWIEWLMIFKSALNKKPSSKSIQSEEEYDLDDFSPSSEHSIGLIADPQELKFCGGSPTETNEIKSFVCHISQTYIQSWYNKISNHEDFLHDLDYILEDILVNICRRSSKLNVNQLFNQIFILTHNHILSYSEMASTRRTTENGPKKKENTQCHQVHPAFRDPKSESIYQSTICETVIDLVGPQDLLLCPLVRTALSDILTHNLLELVVNLISEPAFVYWCIVYFAGDTDLLDHLTKTKNTQFHRERVPTAIKRKLDLSLPLTHKNKQRLLETNTDTKIRRSRLSRTKSFSFNSLLDLDDPVLDSSMTNDAQDSLPRKTSDSNICNSAQHSESSCDPLLNTSTTDEFFVARPPFSLFPVPGHSRKAEICLRKSSPNRMFQCLPIKKAKTTNNNMHTSQSLDELLLPTAKVFQSQGSSIQLTVKDASPAPVTLSLEVEQAEEATEVADLQQFYNIRILSTEELFDSRRRKYILYGIEYDYLEPEMTVRGDEERVLVPCTAMVRRRFREFLALQSRLEHPKLKTNLKGIKGPSKWLSSTFSPSDKRNVEERRLFLQRYLQQLCNKKALVNSAELQEFLAYKGDAHIAFVKKAPDLAVHKIVARGFMGAFDLLKNAIPSLPQDSPSSNDSLKAGLLAEKCSITTRSLLPGFSRSKSDSRLPSLEFNCRIERVSPLSQQIYNFLDSFDTSSSPEDSRPSSPSLLAASFQQELGPGPSRGLFSTSVPAWKRAASRLDGLQALPPTGPRLRGDGCDSLDLQKDDVNQRAAHLEKIQESFQAEIPLANTLIDTLLCLLFPAHTFSDDYVVVTFKIIFGDMIHKWLQKQLGLLSSREHCVHYLHNLHQLLWPPTPDRNLRSKNPKVCKEAAFQALSAFFSGKLPLVLGLSDVSLNINMFLDSLENSVSNRNLVYQIIDIVMDMMCAQDLQQNIL